MKKSFQTAVNLVTKLWNELNVPLDYRDIFTKEYIEEDSVENYLEILQEISTMRSIREQVLEILLLIRQNEDKDKDEKNNELDSKLEKLKSEIPWMRSFIVGGKDYFAK